MSKMDDDNHSVYEEAEGTVVIDIPCGFSTRFGSGEQDESRSKRNCWLPFPPGPLNHGWNRSSHLKASQVAMAPSPDRMKTYELQVKHLYYKLPPEKQSQLSTAMKRFQSKFTRDHEDVIEKPSDRYILNNINFDAKPGEVLAIAGRSGAGKSTLLEILAGRTKPTSPPGCLLINDQEVDVGQFQRVSGYVMQDDALFPCLTVMETLLFSARLRLPPAIPWAEKLARVQSVLDELGLQHAANTRIGNEMIRGISGGERRRVSIGVDVIHNPAVLILDEPTSGLDSAGAMNIVEMLRSMAESHNRTVILSIHQPSIRILQLVHSVLLLAEGMVVHHGSLELLALRLEAAGHEIPAQVNVLEYAIDAVNFGEADTIKAKHVTGVKQPKFQDFLLHDQAFYEHSKEFDSKEFHDADDSSVKEPWEDQDYQDYLRSAWGTGNETDHVTFANSSLQETFVLAQRFFKNISRSKELFAARSVQALFAGIALGTLFLKVGKNPAGVQARMGFFAFTLTFFLSGTTEGLPIFLQERHILMRETSRGAYRVSSYVLSNALVFAPFLLIMGLLYSIPAYWLVLLYPSLQAFFYFSLVLWVVLLMANSFVSFFSAFAPNFIMGTSLISACMGAFFLFSGFFISMDKIPDYWIFMHYLSLFKYPFDGLLINEYENQLEVCFGSFDSSGVCSMTGMQVLQNAGVKYHNKWTDVGIMLAFTVAYRLLSYVLICSRLLRRR